MYGAPVDADIPACVGADINSCNGFIEEGCSYEGGDLGLDPDDGHVADTLECQAECIDLDFLGCAYFVYGITARSCHLMDSSMRRTCTGISGPPDPRMGECVPIAGNSRWKGP